MTERQMNTNIVMAFVNDAETQEVLKTLSLTHLDLTLEVQTGGVDEAIEYLKTNRSPKVLIVDVSEAQLPISQMQKLGETCDPGVKVIAMGDRNEVGIFRDLLEIGVKDYIAKPANTTLIVRSLERVLTSTPANTDVRTGFASTGQVIAFVNHPRGLLDRVKTRYTGLGTVNQMPGTATAGFPDNLNVSTTGADTEVVINLISR